MRCVSLAALLMAGCGESSPGEASGGAGGSDTGSTSSSGGEGGGAEAGSGGAGGAVDPARLPDSGVIGLYFFGEAGGNHEHEVGASFRRGRPVELDVAMDCEVRTEGSCIARRCATSSSYEEVEHLDAGALGVTGTLVDVSLSRDETGAYVAGGPGALFAPGATVEVTASGAEVPGFALELTTPAHLTSVDPPFDALVVTPGEDLAIQWTLEGAGGQVKVWLLASGPEDWQEDVFCTFDADAGGGVIPASLLPSLEETSPYAATIWTSTQQQVAVGSHDVTLYVSDLGQLGNWSVSP